MITVIKQIKFIAAIAIALGLSGCQTLKNAYYGLGRTGQIITGTERSLINHQKCPAAFVVEELGLVHQFAHNETKDKNLQSSANIQITSHQCEYDRKSVTLDTELIFSGALGSKGRLMNIDKPVYSYPFFVAITDRSGKIMTKPLFTASINFNNESNTGTYTETIRLIIPIDNPNNGHDYAVMVGFQLSDEQLEYNRGYIKKEKSRQKKTVKYVKTHPLEKDDKPVTSPHNKSEGAPPSSAPINITKGTH